MLMMEMHNWVQWGMNDSASPSLEKTDMASEIKVEFKTQCSKLVAMYLTHW